MYHHHDRESDVRSVRNVPIRAMVRLEPSELTQNLRKWAKKNNNSLRTTKYDINSQKDESWGQKLIQPRLELGTFREQSRDKRVRRT
jgi:hypothetical protein